MLFCFEAYWSHRNSSYRLPPLRGKVAAKRTEGGVRKLLSVGPRPSVNTQYIPVPSAFGLAGILLPRPPCGWKRRNGTTLGPYLPAVISTAAPVIRP